MMSLVIAIPTVSATPLAASGHVYYVKPNESYHCPHEPCHTLAYYVANVTTYFTSNTTMIFLPGNHSLANGTVQIGNITDLTLIGNDSFIPGPYGLPPEPSSRVKCNGSGVFSFENITGLGIQNLTFLGCGGTIKMLDTALFLCNIFDLTMSGVTVRNSSGYGLYGNILGNSNITDSTFAFNSGSHSYYGGNMELNYSNCPRTTAVSMVYIGHSNFLYGRTVLYASGLDIVMQCDNVKVIVDNVTMIGNEGNKGGNFAIYYSPISSRFPVIVKNCHIEGGVADIGAGMYISLATDGSHCSYGEFLHISNTTFANNHAWSVGGGIYMAHTEQPEFCLSPGFSLVIEHSVFNYNNKSVSSHILGGVAIHTAGYHIPTYLVHNVPLLQLFFINCTFSQNCDAHDNVSSAAVFTTSTYIINSTFQDNNCTAITGVNSDIIFGGNVTIARNIGNNGGGLILCDNSFMYLQSNTTLRFSGNHAKHTGGAIYAGNSCLEGKSVCFFQFVTRPLSQAKRLSSIHVLLESNSAIYAGSAVYGGSIDYCYFLLSSQENRPSSFVFNSIFSPNNSSSDMSFITSDPVGVCFCDHNMTWRNCSNKDLHVAVYPGETFIISVVVVGQRNGSVPGQVFASFLHETKNHSLLDYEYIQTVTHTSCFPALNYTVFSTLPHEALVLRALPAENNVYSPYVIVELQPCPLGFELTDGPQYHCDCIHILAEHGVSCDINGPSIHRQAPVWIGYDYSSNEILFQHHCPLDYCKPHDIVIATNNTSFNQEEQCAFNRKGILCGECRENLSLALGSSQCLPCSNVYLLLLLAFAVAGVALVVLIAVCNLTVTEGTINGLIFYTNIIQINRATFFPPLPHNSFISGVLTVFISWINLDLGIQTCFYDGMDTYTKTWLQFAFPIYIWVIAGVIIILSRKFANFARLVGRNGVQLLATLLLISYAKIKRTVIAVLSFDTIEHSNSSRSTAVWRCDGNILYLQGKHFPLFVVAALFGLIALLCTFIMLFIQCLQKKSNVKLLLWVNRLKPLFDAYTGPYKDKYRFWTGFLIFIRDFLFIVHALNAFGTPDVNMGMTVLVCFLLLIILHGGIYKKWPLDILELSFFLNLGILCTATVYVNNHGGNQAAVAYTSVGIAFVTFLGILFYHTYTKTTSSYLWRGFSIWLSRRRNPQVVLEPVVAEGDSSAEENEPLLIHTPRVVHMRDQYREPLLASN